MNDYSSKCKEIINKVKNYELNTLLLIVSLKLLEVEDSWTKKESPHIVIPFTLLKLVRLTIENAGENSPKILSESFRDVVPLYNSCHNLQKIDPKFLKFKEDSDIDKFMRLMMYEQAWFQEKVSSRDMGRLIMLFEDLPSNSKIISFIKKKTSLDIITFIEISMMFFAHINTIATSASLPFVDISTFKNINYNFKMIENYVNVFSLPVKKVKESLKEYNFAQKIYPDFSISFIEPFPFKIIPPALILSDKLFVYSRNVFNYFLKYHVYHLLKTDKQVHEKWGKRFEVYVGKLLERSNLRCLNENILKKKIKGKVVDFLYPNSSSNIIIECKAVEMSQIAQVNQDNSILLRHTDSNVIKAIEQAYSIIHELQNINFAKLKQKDNFMLIIVTYKKLMLPQGKRLWKEYLSEIEFKHYNPSILPPENIFLMSISEFEYFLASNDIHKSLQVIKEEEKSFKERKMYITDYLKKDGLVDIERISFIKEKFDKCVENLLNKSFPEEMANLRSRKCRMN